MSTEQTLNPQNKFLSWFSPPTVLPDSVGVRRVSDPVSITCLPPLTQRTFIIPQASAIHQHWAEQWGHRGDIFLVPALEEYTEMAGGSESKYSNMPGPEHSISRYPKSILTSCQPVLCVAAAVSLSQAPSKKEPPVPPPLTLSLTQLCCIFVHSTYQYPARSAFPCFFCGVWVPTAM